MPIAISSQINHKFLIIYIVEIKIKREDQSVEHDKHSWSLKTSTEELISISLLSFDYLLVLFILKFLFLVHNFIIFIFWSVV
jgi:sensor histidine kinase YesM